MSTVSRAQSSLKSLLLFLDDVTIRMVMEVPVEMGYSGFIRSSIRLGARISKCKIHEMGCRLYSQRQFHVRIVEGRMSMASTCTLALPSSELELLRILKFTDLSAESKNFQIYLLRTIKMQAVPETT